MFRVIGQSLNSNDLALRACLVMTPSSPPPLSSWRWKAVVGCILTAWVVLAGRMIQLQWVSRAQFASRAVRQRTIEEPLIARPGDIMDRHGRVLATSTPRQSLYLDPAEIDDPWEFAWTLAEALPIEAPELAKRIEAASDKHFLWVRRRIDDEQVRALRQLHLPEATYGLRTEYLRRYPQGSVAAHVLGQRDIDGLGHGGVEEQFQPQLAGRNGVRQLQRDARGYILEVRGERPAMAGDTIRLSLDTVLQVETERRLDQVMEQLEPVSACAVVLDPRSGEVLSMASRPAFDPNDPSTASSDAWRNLAIHAIYEPGSTIKPLVVAYAVDRGAIEPTESFDCMRGAYRMGPRVLHDHHRYGVLSLEDVLIKSSNIGMAKIGERLANDRLCDCMIRFGFGQKTGIELPGELPGLLHPLEKWTRYSTGSVPMGQELSATPLQMLAAHAALANGGMLQTPHLVLGVHPAGEAASAETARSVIASRVVERDSAKWVVEKPMVGVVERGTGKGAKIAEWSVFGKTGTSQKVEANGKYSHSRHVASFVCGAPAVNPAVMVLVTIDEPTKGPSDFGGIAAAPAARDILERALMHLRVPKPSPQTDVAETLYEEAKR
jgi:cell division protein FtsI (penicillin-binding protein 3)